MALGKPSDKEQEFFQKQELELIRVAREKAAKEAEESEKTRLKELHYMRCPKCGQHLEEIHLRGVEIDKCFSCGGIWFDEGELDMVTQDARDSLIGKIRNVLK